MNAFDGPIHWQQVATSGAYVFVTVLGLVAMPIMFSNSELPLALSLTVYLALVAICVVSWLYIELTDPSMPGGVACPCMKRTQSSQANCSLCRKPVVGLDHHCYFLNTCIGKRNYAFFFALSLCATLQMLAQVVFSVLGMTVWIERGNDNVLYYVLVAIQTLIAAVAGGATSSLLGFHVYLLWIGMGTYDWMWAKQDKIAEKARRENQARFEAEQQARLQLQREQQQAQGAAPAAPAGRVAITVESHPVAAAGAAAAGVGDDDSGGLYAGFGATAAAEDDVTSGGGDSVSSRGDEDGGVDADDGGAGAEGEEMIGVEYVDETGGVYDDDAAGAYDVGAAGGAFDEEGHAADGFGQEDEEEEEEEEHERVQRVPGTSSAGSTGAPSADSVPGTPTQMPAEQEGQEPETGADPSASQAGIGAQAHEVEDAAAGAASEVLADGQEPGGESSGSGAAAPAAEPDEDTAAAGDDEQDEEQEHGAAAAEASESKEEEEEEVEAEAEAATEEAAEEAEAEQSAEHAEEAEHEAGAAAAAPAVVADLTMEEGPVEDSCDSTGRPGSAGELQPEAATPQAGQA